VVSHFSFYKEIKLTESAEQSGKTPEDRAWEAVLRSLEDNVLVGDGEGEFPLSAVTRETSLNDLDADSLGIIEFSMGVEDTLEVTIPDDELSKRNPQNLGQFADLVAEILRKQGKQAA
jgi:acyl carrier protein